jgi:hypothetical protein
MEIAQLATVTGTAHTFLSVQLVEVCGSNLVTVMQPIIPALATTAQTTDLIRIGFLPRMK